MSERGCELLDELRLWLSRHIITASEFDLDILAIWAVHTHLAAETYTTPRLQFDSPVPGCGKTTCLEHLQRLCRKPMLMAQVSSPALLARALASEPRTLLIDEVDRTLRPDKEGVEDLLAILNSGYKVGAVRPVLVPVKGGSWEVAEMPTFAPVAMARNQPNLPDDTKSRMIRVLLFPDLDGAAEESDWELIEPDALRLRKRIEEWADQVRDDVRHCRPSMPDGITGRFREKWQPLRRVAELAGGRWPNLIDRLAVADRKEWEMDKADGLVKERPAMLVLRHIHEVWPDGEVFMPTIRLCHLLVQRFPDVWGERGPLGKDLTVQRLGRMLAGSYRVHTDRLGDSPRGYRLSDLEAASRHFRQTPHLATDGTDGIDGTDSAPVGSPVPSVPSITYEAPIRRLCIIEGCSRARVGTNLCETHQ